MSVVLPFARVLIAGTMISCACACDTDVSASTSAPASSSTTSTAQTKAWPPELRAEIDAAARDALRNGTTGAIVGISDPSRGDYLKAYGTADTAGTPMTTDMHYRIASLNKTFTAQAILELAERNRLTLSDTLDRYVPDIPFGDAITIGDLLGMRGGVYDFTTDADFLRRYTADPLLPGWSPDDVLGILRANPTKAIAPNTRTRYSDSEYILLGMVLEKVSGTAAHDYLNDLAGRLGLANTRFPTDDAIAAPFTRGYLSTGKAEDTPPYPDCTLSNPSVPWTAGAMTSTVPDMMRYAPMLAEGAQLTPRMQALRQAFTPLTSTGVRLQYGLGITQLGDWVGHDGSIFGYSNMVFRLPAQRATVVVMVNAGNGEVVPAQALWGELVKKLYPDTLPQWP